MRRVKLHQFLIDRAIDAGAELGWGAQVLGANASSVTTTSESYSYRWLIGADGHNSQVRKWMRLEPPRLRSRRRFGFCSHFGVRPWSDVTEVHWAKGSQIFVTPMKGAEVGVAVLSRNPALRIEQAIGDFPELAERLGGAARTTKEAGDITRLTVLPAVARDRVALSGDASGTVDALTGHGLSLSFQQALPLAEAMSRGDLAPYQTAHRKISAVPVLMTRLMLLMTASDWIRRRTIRLFQNSPGLFSRMLEIHTEAAPLSSVGLGDLASFGWQFLKA
jgi:flavin-dependent dehydrogenase